MIKTNFRNFDIEIDEEKLRVLYEKKLLNDSQTPAIEFNFTNEYSQELTSKASNKFEKSILTFLSLSLARYKPKENEIKIYLQMWSQHHFKSEKVLKKSLRKTLAHELSHALSVNGFKSWQSRAHNLTDTLLKIFSDKFGNIFIWVNKFLAICCVALLGLALYLQRFSVLPKLVVLIITLYCLLSLLCLTLFFLFALAIQEFRELATDSLARKLLKQYAADFEAIITTKQKALI